MSVKSKVKRCNKRIVELEKEVEMLNRRLNNQKTTKHGQEQLYENIIKFAITNHVGGLKAGMMVDYYGIDKMSDLKLDIERSHIEHAYIMRVRY